MAQIIREIRVDVSQPNVFQAIVAKQLDCNSRFLKITLVDFGVKIEVPETAKVTINANRPDGKSQSFVGVANNDGTITVPLAQWMLEVAGELKCDVSVINTTDNKRLTSTDFFVNVQEAANKSTDISENPDGEIRVITPTQKIDKNSSDDEYPSAKAVYDLDNITATATGSAITIESSQAPLQNLKLFGKTEQNGTPTPDAPVPIVSVGDSGSFTVKIQGENVEEQTLTMPYNLQGIRNVKCEIDFNRGVHTQKFCYTRATSVISGFLGAQGTHFMGALYTNAKASDNSKYGAVLCNIAENVPADIQYTTNTRPATISITKTGIVQIAIEGITTLADLNAYLSENEVYVVYELATPIGTPLTEEQLNAYRHLTTNKGTTTVLSECEDTEITYYVNKPNAQAIGSLHEQINKDYIKLQQAIISTGGSTL
jgi:hypothetical protein